MKIEWMEARGSHDQERKPLCYIKKKPQKTHSILTLPAYQDLLFWRECRLQRRNEGKIVLLLCSSHLPQSHSRIWLQNHSTKVFYESTEHGRVGIAGQKLRPTQKASFIQISLTVIARFVSAPARWVWFEAESDARSRIYRETQHLSLKVSE